MADTLSCAECRVSKPRGDFSAPELKTGLLRVCNACLAARVNPSLMDMNCPECGQPRIHATTFQASQEARWKTTDMSEWDVSDVAQWAQEMLLPAYHEKAADLADKLRTGLISGSALLMLDLALLQNSLGLPLGPALDIIGFRQKFAAVASANYMYKNDQPRCFQIENVYISNDGKGFVTDILVDSLASFELSVPWEKAQQLDLTHTKTQVGEAAHHSFTCHYLTPDVLISLPDVQGMNFSGKLQAVYTTPGESHQPKYTQTPAPQSKSTDPLPSNAPPNIQIKLSPIKKDSKKYTELPILGFHGLVRLGLDINFKTQILTLAKLYLR